MKETNRKYWVFCVKKEGEKQNTQCLMLQNLVLKQNQYRKHDKKEKPGVSVVIPNFLNVNKKSNQLNKNQLH